MSFYMKGALIEYGSDFMGPIPNVVLFQFNPESLRRELQIPSRPTGAESRETSQAGDVPVENISLTAHFSATDKLNDKDVVERGIGIGHRLAALEKMIHPKGRISQLSRMAVDAVTESIARRRGETHPAQGIPREHYPRILFVWGTMRILPVTITSMSINEEEYDFLLNPVRAEMTLGLSVINVGRCSDDIVAQGAMEYTNLAKDALAVTEQGYAGVDIYELFSNT